MKISLRALSQAVQKEKAHLIINLNYGLPEADRATYKMKLTQALENTGMSFVLLENFFQETN